MTWTQRYRVYLQKVLGLPVEERESLDKALRVLEQLRQASLRERQILIDDWVETFVIPPKIRPNRKLIR